MSALTLVVGIAPSLALLAYFWLRDRYEREPLRHLLAAYLLGMYALVAAQGVALAAESWISAEWLRAGGVTARLVDAFVLSGFVEELAKWVLLVAAVQRWRELDEPLDGLVYGVALSLGFAALENVLYVARLGLEVGWGRAVFAVPAHALFGGTMGYYVGRVKFPARVSRPRPLLDRVLCLALPVLFHGAYDFALLHRLDVKVWAAVTGLSLGLWIFVLRRVERAQRASPYRPKTMPPGLLR